jgi:oligopeptide transport system substrate-binding protein
MKRKSRVLSLLLVFVMLAMIVVGCGQKNNETSNGETEGDTAKGSEEKGNMIVANISSEPRTIDPAINNATDGSTVIFNIFEGLARINLDDDTPEPGIAENWDVSEDGTKYTFHLREDLKWSDGTPLTAEDVKYGIVRVLDPNTASSYAYHAYCIKNGKDFYEGKAKAEDVGVKVIDDTTLEIELEYPVPYFLDIISWHLLLPLKADVVENNPDGWSQNPETIISNGPFRVKEWKHNEYILLEKNPYYWDKDNVKLDNVKLVMITDENTALTAFKTGSIDYMSNIPPVQIPQLVSSGEAEVSDQLGTYFYCFNVNKKPFDDVRVRKALALAIDRQALTKTITQGGQKPAIGFIPFGLPGADKSKDFREEVDPYIDINANVEEAKKLLAEAGYPEGEGFPEVSLTYNTNENHKAVAEAVQAMWKKNLGINVSLTNQEWKVFIDTRSQGDYDIARHGYFSDFNDLGSLFDLWVTDSPNNDCKYSNPKYDELVTAARKEQDPAKRAELYHQAEDVLMEDMPVLPVYYYTQNYLLKPHVKDMHISPLGWEFYRNAYIEK